MSRYSREPRYDREAEIEYRDRSGDPATYEGEAYYRGVEFLHAGKMMPHRERGYYGYREGNGYVADSAESTDADSTIYDVSLSCMFACSIACVVLLGMLW